MGGRVRDKEPRSLARGDAAAGPWDSWGRWDAGIRGFFLHEVNDGYFRGYGPNLRVKGRLINIIY